MSITFERIGTLASKIKLYPLIVLHYDNTYYSLRPSRLLCALCVYAFPASEASIHTSAASNKLSEASKQSNQ